MTDKIKVTTDLIVEAARATRAVYERYSIRHASRGHFDSCLAEAKRASIMEALANDDNLCEMLAGRIHQLGHAVK